MPLSSIQQYPGKTLAHYFCRMIEYCMLSLLTSTMSMLIRDVSWYTGHTGPVLLQATTGVLPDCSSPALCISAWHQHMLGPRLLLLKQTHNSGRSTNPQLLLRPLWRISPADGAPASSPGQRGIKKKWRRATSSAQCWNAYKTPAGSWSWFSCSETLEGILQTTSSSS